MGLNSEFEDKVRRELAESRLTDLEAMTLVGLIMQQRAIQIKHGGTLEKGVGAAFDRMEQKLKDGIANGSFPPDTMPGASEKMEFARSLLGLMETAFPMTAATPGSQT